MAMASGPTAAQGPSFDCHAGEPNAIEQRICSDAELRAIVELAPPLGPVYFTCNDAEASSVAAVFFETEPATMYALHGNDTALLVVQPSGSGAKYRGQHVTFWEHHGEAQVTWGHDAQTMRCIKSKLSTLNN